MRLSFIKEDMYTASGFAIDSFEEHQAAFVDATSEEDFGATFLADFRSAREAVGKLTGAGLGIGATSQLTRALHELLDAVPPLLDRLELRLDLVEPAKLTVPVKDFGLTNLRKRLATRDAEGAVKALGKLNAAIAANLEVLAPRGHKPADTKALTDAETKIDDANRKQNKGQNAGTKGTVDENAVYKTLDGLLKKLLRTGRKLYKGSKRASPQYLPTAILARMHAGERPKVRGADGK